jgi:hypothetical protein
MAIFFRVIAALATVHIFVHGAFSGRGWLSTNSISNLKFYRPGSLAFLTLSAYLASVAAFAAGIQFEDVTTKSGVAKITTSYGGAWGNLNGDIYPDLYLNNHARMNSLYINGINNDKFYDTASQVAYWKNGGGNEDVHGGSWADYDNDGDDDLLVSTGICCNPQFFENQNGTLIYKTIEKGFGGDPDKGGRMPIWFDYNNDGVLETSIMTFYGAPTMELQNGVYTKLPLADFKCIQNQYGILIDITGDGKLDVICVHRGSNFPERALDISTYPPVNISASLPPATLVNDIVIGDFDNNLRNDMLLLRGVLRPSQIKVFDGNKIEGIFVEIDGGFSFKSSGALHVRLERGGETTANQAGIYVGASGVNPGSSDFWLNSADAYVQGLKPFVDQGMPEIYIGYDAATERWTINQYLTSFGRWVTTYFELESANAISNLSVTGLKAVDGAVKSVYISNLAGQGLVNTTTSTVFNVPIQCVGGTAADFDNDMDQDIYLVCRGGVENLVNRMYENNGNGTFTLLPDEGGARSVTGVAVANRVGTGEGVMSADYNLDGLIDLVVTNGLNMVPHDRNGGPNQLFKNIANPRNWVLVDLVGTLSNRNGIGARVFATVGGVTQLREQNGGFHRWAQDHQRIHFGLADNTTVDLEVRWPSGRVELFNNLASNELYRITEAQNIEVVSRDIDPNNTAAACGKPTFAKGSEAHLFIWKDCGGTEKWNIRATGGGSTKVLQFTGVINSATGFNSVEPFSFENGDLLTTGPSDTLSYTLKSLNAGEDGASFALNPGTGSSCFQMPAAPPGAKVYLGSQRQEMTAPFDLNTLGPCL